MTHTFHTYHSGIEVFIDPPTQTQLARFKADSRNAEEQRQAFRLCKTHANSYFHLKALLNRLTLPNSTVSVVLLAGTLFAACKFT
jgi:hypothetical protein